MKYSMSPASFVIILAVLGSTNGLSIGSLLSNIFGGLTGGGKNVREGVNPDSMFVGESSPISNTLKDTSPNYQNEEDNFSNSKNSEDSSSYSENLGDPSPNVYLGRAVPKSEYENEKHTHPTVEDPSPNSEYLTGLNPYSSLRDASPDSMLGDPSPDSLLGQASPDSLQDIP